MEVKEITENLEEGLRDLFNSEKYKNYLTTMSKFHNYSFNNTLLIAMQRPDASLVAGYGAWQKNFEPGGYYSGDDYAKYVQQPIEWDAKNFAKQYSDVEGYTPEYAGSW